MITHQPCPSDVSDAEWQFVPPDLCLLPEDAGQREHDLSVELAHVDQGYTGGGAFDAAAGRGIIPDVVRLPEARRGFVPLPRRWVVERSFGWMARFRRLARDYERLSGTLGGLHYVAFSSPMLRKAAPMFAWSSSRALTPTTGPFVAASICPS